jgi:hypothetical protein
MAATGATVRPSGKSVRTRARWSGGDSSAAYPGALRSKWGRRPQLSGRLSGSRMRSRFVSWPKPWLPVFILINCPKTVFEDWLNGSRRVAACRLRLPLPSSLWYRGVRCLVCVSRAMSRPYKEAEDLEAGWYKAPASTRGQTVACFEQEETPTAIPRGTTCVPPKSLEMRRPRALRRLAKDSD